MAQKSKLAAIRYHPSLTLLHWVLAALIIATLMVGYFELAPMANTSPEKIGLLRLHMAGGMTIFFLMAARLLLRFLTPRPAPATAGHPALDRLANFTHYAFYILVALMAATGLSTAVISGLNLIVFGDSGDPLPPSLLIYPTRVAHGYVAVALAALIGLHISAALYHQFFLRDGLLRRMWFGDRK
jgi:cytochrome b561